MDESDKLAACRTFDAITRSSLHGREEIVFIADAKSNAGAMAVAIDAFDTSDRVQAKRFLYEHNIGTVPGAGATWCLRERLSQKDQVATTPGTDPLRVPMLCGLI